MSSFSASPQPSLLNLDSLESDPAPTFVLKIGAGTIEFEILFCNEAFRKLGLREVVLAKNRTAILFRSWAQAVGLFRDSYTFTNRTWTATVAGLRKNWKVVRATDVISKDHDAQGDAEAAEIRLEDGATAKKRARDGLLKTIDQNPWVPLKDLPKASITARWESLQTMMEMSDVGVFEYTPYGKLIHANDAWYRLSNHPKDLPAHVDFSFMDLAYPDDQARIMSAWNTLVQGDPVTFEMRWKARPDSGETAQWVLSACVPVFDDDKKLISIAGNTIDINAQKKSQEVAQMRVEALERARQSEQKFARFAQLAPVAIYIFRPDKGIQYVNDQFFELTGQPRMSFDQLSWTDLIVEEDIDKLQKEWSAMMEEKKTKQMQYRLKKTWINQEGVRSNIWVQGSSYPELDESGNVISVMGTLFDISQFKWAESVQRRRIEEALEAKRQQENFIDMTSHELRNPLSAVVQCADSVINTLQHLSSQQVAAMHTEIEKVNDEISMCIDSLQTIVACSLHQKRIIDDVLTLSKLDSNLLLITPMRVQPAVVVCEAMKMFDVECSQAHVTLEFKQDESLKGFEWVMLDPSRMLQVLINLLTNAIKFTKDRETRNVTVTLGGSWTRPSTESQTVAFAKHEHPLNDACDKPEWGSGKRGFIWLKVEDTGCGMTDDEQKKLFSRFTQATPRTHIKYGGSGLGLFISKSLAALQGGSVGVSSKPGSGSTFVFYVGTRIAQAPHDVDTGNTMPAAPYSDVSAEDAMKATHLNILMVEDNLVNQKVLSTQLQKAGCNVSVAGNGQEALEWLKLSVYWRGDKRVGEESGSREDEVLHNGIHTEAEDHSRHELDIILMDIEMPVMDGLTCARLIRDYEQQGLLAPPDRPPQLESSSLTPISPISPFRERRLSLHVSPSQTWPKLPILAVSANARSEQVEQALAAGMNDAISKPFRIPELWPKMSSLVPRCSSIHM